MATRGAKPKPAELRVIDGTHRTTRHGPVEDVLASRKGAASTSLERPASLKGPAAKAWDQFISPAHWLDIHRLPAAIIFCRLWAEYERKPLDFAATKHAQIRAYMAELGLTDERNRGAQGGKSKDAGKSYLR